MKRARDERPLVRLPARAYLMDAMTLAVLAGSAAACSAFVLGLVALAASRAPGWRSLAWFAFVSFSAAGYAAFDLAVLLDLPAEDRALGVQLAMMCGVLEAIAWVGYLATSNGRPLRRRHRVFFVAGGLLATLSLVPGLVVTREISVISIDWLGVVYRTPGPTTVGLFVYAFLILTFVWVALFWDRDPARRGSWPRAIGAGFLALLALNDILVSAGALPLPLMLDFGAVLVIAWTSIDHQRRFVVDAQRLVDFSATLESEVAARTRALGDAEEALRKSELLAGLGRMASGVAHEINNPAAVVQFRLEYLREIIADLEADGDEITPEARESVEESLRAVQSIARIVRQLLDVGRSERTPVIGAGTASLADIAKRAIATLETVKFSARVVCDIERELAVRGDRDAIEQALLNVLTNAFDAIQSKGGDGTIYLAAQPAGDVIRLIVRDEGPGIAPEIRDRLFEPFTTTKAVGQGTGLGLSLARGLLRSQGGDLLLVSSSASGTEMALELLRGELSDVSEGVSAPAHAPPPRSLEPRDILVYVVDDDEDLLEALGLMLETRFRAAQFQTVASALEAARRNCPDVVVCDVMMPDGGAETWFAQCADIDPALPDRTVILTGGPTTREATALVDSHRDRTLVKPCDLRSLLEAVERVLGPEEGDRSAPDRRGALRTVS
jgi:signal transduction histidine kinase/CheY-like chemotaxis protein